MPIDLPNLDDRRFTDLVDEARALIPALAPEWTNHNPSDPGITLVELFAYLTELLIYRLNRVTNANLCAFLKLLNGPGWSLPADGDVAAEVRRTVQALRQPGRAITPNDFELLARAADARVARAHCVAGRDPTAPGVNKPAHLSLMVLGTDGGDPSADLLVKLIGVMDRQRLLATRLHVCVPVRLKLGLRFTLWLEDDAVDADVLGAATMALQAFLHPLSGGEDGQGWPFGRAVYVSELYRLLDGVSGVDYVEPIGTQDEIVVADASRRVPASGALVAVSLAPDELIDVQIDPLTLVTRRRGS
jgi:hypothetical protein